MATVRLPNGTEKTVKTLGWLLHNLDEVHTMERRYFVDGTAQLTAWLYDGRRFTCDFASSTVCAKWLRRTAIAGRNIAIRHLGPCPLPA